MKEDYPIFINARDRMSSLAEMVAWLLGAGHRRITVIDNDSTWPPMLRWLNQAEAELDGVRVLRLGRNEGSRAIWKLGLAPHDEFYVYTDPDCVPLEECPKDLLDHCRELADRYPHFPKVGVGLHLDDVPDDLHCLAWERSLVGIASPEHPQPQGEELEPGVFASLVDTTFAFYRPGAQFGYQGLRTSFPYQVRHTSWYVQDLDPENRHYLERADAGPLGSSWRQMREP